MTAIYEEQRAYRVPRNRLYDYFVIERRQRQEAARELRNTQRRLASSERREQKLTEANRHLRTNVARLVGVADDLRVQLREATAAKDAAERSAMQFHALLISERVRTLPTQNQTEPAAATRGEWQRRRAQTGEE